MILESTSFRSYDLFGAKITPTTRDGLMELIRNHVRAKAPCVVASQNLHGMHVRLWDAALNRLHALPQTYVHIDGMPLIWLCKMCGIDVNRAHRLTLLDWIWPLLSMAAENGWRVYYLGGKEEVVQAGATVIRKRLPALQLRTHHGYIIDADGSASWEVVRDIVEYGPQLVLVGMGMGVQERWILQNLAAFGPATVCTVGACIEYIAGAAKTPPRWLGSSGLEWAFRFFENPGRFWHRYLVEPWFVLAYILWYQMLPESARAAGKLDPDTELQPAPPTLASLTTTTSG